MKYQVTYQRKVKAGKPYEMLTIGLSKEFDDKLKDPALGFLEVANKVDKWIDEERDRLLKEAVPRPEQEVK